MSIKLKQISVFTILLILLGIILVVLLLIKNQKQELELSIPIGEGENEINLIPAIQYKLMPSSHPKIFFYGNKEVGVFFPNHNEIRIYNQNNSLNNIISLNQDEQYIITGMDASSEKIIISKLLIFDYYQLTLDAEAGKDLSDLDNLKSLKMDLIINKDQKTLDQLDKILYLSPIIQEYDIKFFSNSTKFSMGGYYEIEDNHFYLVRDTIKGLNEDEKKELNESNIPSSTKTITIRPTETYSFQCNILLENKEKSVCLDRNVTVRENKLLDANFLNKHTIYLIDNNTGGKVGYNNVIDIDVDRQQNKIVFIYLSDDEKSFIVKEIKL